MELSSPEPILSTPSVPRGAVSDVGGALFDGASACIVAASTTFGAGPRSRSSSSLSFCVLGRFGTCTTGMSSGDGAAAPEAGTADSALTALRFISE